LKCFDGVFGGRASPFFFTIFFELSSDRENMSDVLWHHTAHNRVQYDTVYRTVVKYQTTTEKKHACCPGWTHTDKHTHGCLQGLNQLTLKFQFQNP
jgi:hypothetical protein